MARRVLGGGRVLGSGKNLSPATSTPSPQPKGRLSPSTSSLSLNSQASASASASQFSPEAQDLASRISLDNAETSISAAPTVSGTQLACPICNEEMVRITFVSFKLMLQERDYVLINIGNIASVE